VADDNAPVTGYVTDTPYADTFFRELSPAWLRYAAAVNGVAAPAIEGAFTYLELGCGFGSSTVINAAAYPLATFHACDFNPAHIDGGRQYARTLGVDNLTFHEDAFSALVDRDLPAFDFIVLHGVYSWVDADARAAVRALIDRRLKPGGLVYVSYNALPGWSHELPLRKLLVELAATETGTTGTQGMAAAATLAELRKADWRYFTANPAALGAVDAYLRGDGEYLAHEFMNAAWEPFYAVDVADDFAAIGLTFAGSATLVDNHAPLVLEAKAAEAIGALATDRQRQLATDFARNQRFRRDVFVKADESSRRSGTALKGQPWEKGRSETASPLASAPIGCATDVDDIGLSVRVPRGEIRFREAFIRDVRARLAQGSWRFGSLVASLADSGQDAAGIARNLMFLVAGGALAPFAVACPVPVAAPVRLADPRVSAALTDIVARNTRRAVPSTMHGNGVLVDPADARALLDWTDGGSRSTAAVARLLPTFARLGLVA
jgi:SAM-dependent methyltransferase